MRPDRDGRLEGTTYPADRAPEGSGALEGASAHWRERLASLMVGRAVRVVRPRPGDVLVVSGPPVPLTTRAAIAEALRDAGGPTAVAVFLPPGCCVHVEPPRMASEDRGYRGSATYGADRVFTGVPGEGAE